MFAAGNLSLTIRGDQRNIAPDLHSFAISSAEIAPLHRELSMQSVRAMREEVGTASAPDGAGWSRIVFIAIICALGGVGFLAATILMNGRALSFAQRPAAAQLSDVQTPPSETAPDPAPKPVVKTKPVNDRFQPVDFAPRGEINKAALARCRSHVEAGRAFDGLSPKRVVEIREQRQLRDRDPESICAEYLAAESRAAH